MYVNISVIYWRYSLVRQSIYTEPDEVYVFNTDPSTNWSFVRIFMLLWTVHSYQGVQFAGSRIKGIPSLTPFKFMCMFFLKVTCVKIREQHFVIIHVRYRILIRYRNLITTRCAINVPSTGIGTEIAIILYFSLQQHDWGWKWYDNGRISR